MIDWITFLITGPEENLERFCLDAGVEIFDRRKQTLRCRAHPGAVIVAGDFVEATAAVAYGHALSTAIETDCTMQDLIVTKDVVSTQKLKIGDARATVTEHREEYPVKHLGSHGLKWPPEKKQKRK